MNSENHGLFCAKLMSSLDWKGTVWNTASTGESSEGNCDDAAMKTLFFLRIWATISFFPNVEAFLYFSLLHYLSRIRNRNSSVIVFQKSMYCVLKTEYSWQRWSEICVQSQVVCTPMCSVWICLPGLPHRFGQRDAHDLPAKTFQKNILRPLCVFQAQMKFPASWGISSRCKVVWHLREIPLVPASNDNPASSVTRIESIARGERLSLSPSSPRSFL